MNYRMRNRGQRFARLRPEVLKRAGYRCQICGRSAGGDVRLDTHHIRYRGREHEEIEDLRCLCGDCHFEGPHAVHGDPLRLVASPDDNKWGCSDDRLRARARAIIDREGGLVDEFRLVGRLIMEAIPHRVLFCMQCSHIASLADRYLTCLFGDAMGDHPTLFFMTTERGAYWPGAGETLADAQVKATKTRTWSMNPVFSDRPEPDWTDRLLAM